MGEPAQKGDSDGRFEFGENWSHFVSVLDEHRIAQAQRSLKQAIETETLNGKSFLDIGSGSVLFSLAARRLGARVHYFDYDPQSVACTTEPKRRYFPDDGNWTVEEGSALDTKYFESLEQFDTFTLGVYFRGVLHHTGTMYPAFENAHLPVAPGGLLVIAIYNDQGGRSVVWKRIKKLYNGLPQHLKLPFALLVVMLWELRLLVYLVLTLRPQHYVRE